MRTPPSLKQPALIVFFLGFAISITRSWAALDQIPADPGDDYFHTAAVEPIKTIFSLADGQLIVGIRLIAEFVVMFPLRYQAIITNIVVSLVWAAMSALIYTVLEVEYRSKIWAILLSLALVLSPAASESQVGNIGGTRWALFCGVGIALCSNNYFNSTVNQAKHRNMLVIVLIVILGVTNPIIFALVPTLVVKLFTVGKDQRRRIAILLSLTITLFFLQLISTITSSHDIGRLNEATFFPWSGAGAFWWFNWLFPPALASSVLLALVFMRGQRAIETSFVLALSVTSLSIWAATYLLAGIADRYLIAPFALSVTAGAILVLSNQEKLGSFFLPFVVSGIVLLLVPVVKWYPASWFLKGDTPWSTQVDNAVEVCKKGTVQQVELLSSINSPNLLSCYELLIRAR